MASTVLTPLLMPAPFANSTQLLNTIPTASSPPLASLADGFPSINMIPISTGGVPPSGKDFNGILNWITQHITFISAGGGSAYKFNAAFAAAIGGYPLGAVLQSNDGLSTYVNQVNGNTTDFNATPASIPAQWSPLGGAYFSKLFGLLAGGNVWVGNQSGSIISVGYAATISLNLNAGNNFVIGGGGGGGSGITGNFTMANPTGGNTGQSGFIEIMQDAVGGHTISSFGSLFLNNNFALPNLTASATRRDTLFYAVMHDGRISINGLNNQG